MLLDRLNVPIVLAPLAGGPSTPQLAAAVSGAGGLGFLAAGYLSADQLSERIAAAQSLTEGPLGVNLFAPGAGPTDPAAYSAFVERLRDWASANELPLGEPVERLRDWASANELPLGEPRFSDDDWDAKLRLLSSQPVDVVSFTFGLPTAEAVSALKRAGSEVWVTVTSPDEARQAEDRGADALVVQGAEAGGHRASFVDEPGLAVYGLLPLLALTREITALPLVASGGIATGRSVAAVICAGARAAQVGTAFMLSEEAGTSEAHRAALATDESTVLTRVFSGRLARGIRNRFIAEHDRDVPVAYPEIHYVTAPLRGKAREQNDAGLINLWAGEAHRLAQPLPAAEITARLATEARAAVGALARIGP